MAGQGFRRSRLVSWGLLKGVLGVPNTFAGRAVTLLCFWALELSTASIERAHIHLLLYLEPVMAPVYVHRQSTDQPFKTRLLECQHLKA